MERCFQSTCFKVEPCAKDVVSIDNQSNGAVQQIYVDPAQNPIGSDFIVDEGMRIELLQEP